MSSPKTHLAGEFAALAGRIQDFLAAIPETKIDGAELAAVCERHHIREHVDGLDSDGVPIRTSLAEALDATLATAERRGKRIFDAEELARGAQAEIDRARRDAGAVLAMTGIAKNSLHEAGFNTDTTGWLGALDEALGELHAWRSGRRRAPEAAE